MTLASFPPIVPAAPLGPLGSVLGADVAGLPAPQRLAAPEILLESDPGEQRKL